MWGSPRLTAACVALLIFACDSEAAVRAPHARDGGSDVRADAGVIGDAGNAAPTLRLRPTHATRAFA
jgi:hypothetical protein